MPDRYRRPSGSRDHLRYVGGPPPVITPEHAYEVSKDPVDIDFTRTTAQQTGVTGGLNILGQVQEYLSILSEIHEVSRLVEAQGIFQQVQAQLQPGQSVRVTVSPGPAGQPPNVVISPVHSPAITSTDSDAITKKVEKPGPGSTMCTVGPAPATVTFTVGERAIRIPDALLGRNEVPARQNERPADGSKGNHPGQKSSEDHHSEQPESKEKHSEEKHSDRAVEKEKAKEHYQPDFHSSDIIIRMR